MSLTVITRGFALSCICVGKAFGCSWIQAIQKWTFF